MPPKPGEPLTFLVATNPYDATSIANKKRVRSIAALKSWPERRKRTFEQLEGAGTHTTFFLNPPEFSTETSNPPESSQRARKKAPSKSSKPLVGPLLDYRLVESDRSSDVPSSDGPSEGLSDRECTRSTSPESACSCPACTIIRERRRSSAGSQAWRRNSNASVASSRDPRLLTPPASPTPSPGASVDGGGDPFNCYPVPKKPWFDNVLHHMLTVFAPRGWPALKITKPQGLNWEWFMTQHALAEPALFYVRLLFATGDLINLGAMKPEVSLWLQGEAVRSINEALADPKRATSDAVILAVGRIALHESLYGDRNAANGIHRPAQKRMIAMRGGMKALPFPPLVKRLMRWADNVMAMQGGTPRLLEDDIDVSGFTMNESVTVLEEWVPKEGESLRSQVGYPQGKVEEIDEQPPAKAARR